MRHPLEVLDRFGVASHHPHTRRGDARPFDTEMDPPLPAGAGQFEAAVGTRGHNRRLAGQWPAPVFGELVPLILADRLDVAPEVLTLWGGDIHYPDLGTGHRLAVR